MAVMSINPNDFLTTKKEGEFVTAEEWNRLVALFTVLNNNAMELLSTNQAVDSNKANILHLTAGAVPDESITCEKLSTKYTLKNTYIVTQDTTPVTGKTYYTYENGVYTAVESLSTFRADTVYYELTTEYAKPAINTPEVIGDKVITGEKLADETLTNSNCVPNLIGQLLKNCSIKSYTIPIELLPYVETKVEVKLDKACDVALVLTGTDIILCRKDDPKLLCIGSEYKTVIANGGDYINSDYTYRRPIKYDYPSNLQAIFNSERGYDGYCIYRYEDIAGHYRAKLTNLVLDGDTLTYSIKTINDETLKYNFNLIVLGL